ncbi:ocs element-binding factor 1-like [Phragmites australis]|uniref:ocs element-binding factor 1-like n=1 Tax=Phragmites australis TaxID=29695 RepID=UPI002D78D758|nr:ocs element-binding factor 1-like [Phragmites australis]
MSSSSLSPAGTGRMSGSDGDSAADTHRREKRRLSNRESARRSRLRKQQHLDELVQEAARLQAENARVAGRAADIAAQYARVEQENAILRARAAELGDRLRSVNEVLRVVEEFSGVAMDIQEELPADDPLLRPWQLPCLAATMPIGATAAHMLQY